MKRCVECGAHFDGDDWRCSSCDFSPRQVDSVLSFCEPQGADGFDPDAFDRLVLLEPTSFWFRSRNRLILWAVQHYFPRAERLLAIGCGTGFVLEGLRNALPHLSVAGAELHAGGLHHAAERVPGVELFQFDARKIPFKAEFGVIGAFDVLEHIDADEEVLAEMHTAVKPGGRIVLTVPQHPWMWSAADDYAEHKRRYQRRELLHKVSQAGFVVRRVTSFVSLLLPAMAAVRLREQLSKRPYDPGREHQAARRATNPLERIVDFERSLIEHGVDLPVGGSLLLVADRS